VVAPVRDVRGEVLASLSISGPIYRLAEEKREENIRAVLNSAREIEAVLDAANLSDLKVATLPEASRRPQVRAPEPETQGAFQTRSGTEA
jgi:transcriptional regulator of acetoin/glycerol metabolism